MKTIYVYVTLQKPEMLTTTIGSSTPKTVYDYVLHNFIAIVNNKSQMDQGVCCFYLHGLEI